MRIFVSADIEGIGGIVGREQGRPSGFGYEQARSLMTDSILAVCAAAREAGADEVIVADSHGSGCNIQLERMPEYVQLVQSWPRPLGMMQGIEVGNFTGALLIGYHAGSANAGGVLSHTLSSDLFQDVRFNGRTVSEAAISAAIAGHFGVPILAIAGDDVFVAETRTLLGDLEGAVLKGAYGTTSAISPSPAVAMGRLRAATLSGIANAPVRKLHRVEGPICVEMHLRTRSVAEWLGYLPEVERAGAYTVRYSCQDIIGASRFLMFVTFARASLG
jgi:D-amino peptidase